MKSSKYKLQYVIILLLVQSFLLLMVSAWKGIGILSLSSEILSKIISFISVGLSLLSIIMIREIIKIIKEEVNFQIERIQLKEKDKLIKSLRSQKHDFANHLQIIYSMVQLDKNDRIKEYINGLNKDLSKIKLHKTEFSNSVLDPLLIPKKIKAMEEGMQFNYEIEEGIESVYAPLNKIFRITSNLVDNAIDATKEFESKDKMIKIEGKDQGSQYVLSVYNSGPIIEDDLINEILEPGFSTKGESRGFGLHIIKSLVEENYGRLEIKSEEEYGTEFICYLPKERQSERKVN